jgi:hypothetical protein
MMTKGPPENPPEADFSFPLIDRYLPHGFPPYLGLGLLDRETLRLEPGLSLAEYRQGDDLVYRVTGKYDPATIATDSSRPSPPIEELVDRFGEDSLELYTLVRDALDTPPTPNSGTASTSARSAASKP